MRFSLILVLISVLTTIAKGQNTAESKMLNDTSGFLHNTTLGGYGNILYQRDFNMETATINLERFVLFVGHKFSDKVSFFSELEVEDAKVEGGEEGGEVSLEQCYIRFNLNRNNYLVGGLFIPRIGILNENHLPTSFNGNERTLVETYVIPSTWRELGIALYGSMNKYPVNYSFAVMNGLNSAEFEHGTVIREGRYEGRDASANNLAITGSLQWKKNSIAFQLSGYMGGSVGLNGHQSDSLRLESGMFGTPVILGEGNIQYKKKALNVKVLGTLISIPDADSINQAYANNTPEAAIGFYGEVGYDICYKKSVANNKTKQCILFARYEKLDMNSKVPVNGIEDGTLDQSHIIVGINYLPISNVALKADVRLMHTGDPNPALIINPSPTAPPFENDNTFLNLGIGFSF
jgi:hypothetical protein